MRVVVGSKNPVKINCVRNALSKIYKEVEVEGLEVKSGVPSQPIGLEETMRGAENRAKRCKEKEEADFYIGLEGGITKIKDKLFSFAVCHIISKEGPEGIAMTSWFQLPKEIEEMINKGLELGDAMDEIEGDKNTKQKGGAIEFFTKGLKNRTKLYEEAVINALIPFLRPEFNF